MFVGVSGSRKEVVMDSPMIALVMTVSVGDVSASIQAPIIGNFPEQAPFPRQTRGPTRLIFQKARKRSDMPVRNVIADALAWRSLARWVRSDRCPRTRRVRDQNGARRTAQDRRGHAAHNLVQAGSASRRRGGGKLACGWQDSANWHVDSRSSSRIWASCVAAMIPYIPVGYVSGTSASTVTGMCSGSTPRVSSMNRKASYRRGTIVGT